MAHTPGPWIADAHHAQDYAGRTHGFIRAPGQLVPIAAVVLGVEGMSLDEGRANLAVMAAADVLLDAAAAAKQLLEWIAERASKIAYEQYRESEGAGSNLTFEIGQLTDAMNDGLLASYRDQIEAAVAKAAGALDAA